MQGQGRNLRSRHEMLLYFVSSWSVCISLCLFSFTLKVLLIEQSNKSTVKVQVTNGMLKKEGIKHLYFRVKDNHRKNLQASNCPEECQWNRTKPQEVKDTAYNFIKPTVKGRNIGTFFLTNLGNHSDSTQGQILSETDTTPRGVTFSREGLPDLFWSAFTQVLT